MDRVRRIVLLSVVVVLSVACLLGLFCTDHPSEQKNVSQNAFAKGDFSQDKEPSDNTIQQTDGQQGARNVSLEDILLFGEAGGTYLRTEGPHMAPNPHRFKHINYHTATGVKETIRIK